MSGSSTSNDLSQLRDALVKFFRARTKAEEAEDLAQSVLLKITTRGTQLEDDRRFLGWAWSIARNELTDHYRKKSRAVNAMANQDALAVAPPEDEDNFNALVQPWLHGFIQQLPDEYRDVVRWSTLEGLTGKDIAQKLGLSLPGAKSRIQRGRRLLKQRLEACCDFEVDPYGNVTDIHPKRNCPSSSKGKCG